MRKLVSIAALAGALLTACGGGSGSVAATVDGTDVTVGDVEELIETEGETVPKERFAQVLGSEIQLLIISSAAEEDFGVTLGDDEIAAEADAIFEQVSQEGETREDFLTTRGITEDFLELFARQQLIVDRLRETFAEEVEEPTEEDIETNREGLVTALTTVCASHILVATMEEAEEIMSQLDDGGDFAELAAEFGTDGTAQNGGDLGCNSPTGYVEPFAEAILIAPIGEVYEEIVETQFGFHVIEVADRQEPSEEDLVNNLRETAVAEEFEAWFNSALTDAEVTVEEEYGTWGIPPPSQDNPNPTTPTVIPPAVE